MTCAVNRKKNNFLKQVDLVVSDILSPYNDVNALKEKIKTLINGMDSNDDDIRADSEYQFHELIKEFANIEYYVHLKGYFEYKNDLYKACIEADSLGDFDEWDRVIHGFEKIVESALYKINELN